MSMSEGYSSLYCLNISAKCQHVAAFSPCICTYKHLSQLNYGKTLQTPFSRAFDEYKTSKPRKLNCDKIIYSVKTGKRVGKIWCQNQGEMS